MAGEGVRRTGLEGRLDQTREFAWRRRLKKETEEEIEATVGALLDKIVEVVGRAPAARRTASGDAAAGLVERLWT